MFLEDQVLPLSQEVETQQQNFCETYICPHGTTHNKQILHRDQTGWEENLFGVHHAPVPPWTTIFDMNANMWFLW